MSPSRSNPSQRVVEFIQLFNISLTLDQQVQRFTVRFHLRIRGISRMIRLYADTFPVALCHWVSHTSGRKKERKIRRDLEHLDRVGTSAGETG